jgi:DNA polymerase-3 subunit alpha
LVAAKTLPLARQVRDKESINDKRVQAGMPMKIIRNQPQKLRIARSSSRYWSVHTHSRFSAQDALPSVKDIVARAKELRYPALGLTDHGNIAGSIQLYQECQKAGIKPLPGSELYLVVDRNDPKAKRYHACVVAFSEEGYRNLIRLSTKSHENFHYKPILDFADLAELSGRGQLKGLAITTGCFFGLVVQTLIQDGYMAAKSIVATYASWFEVCYVELQCHKIDQEPLSEAQIASALVDIADELGLKCIMTQDSHYVHEDERADHETMKRLVTWSDNPDEATFPGDGFHLADDAWMREHHGVHMERGLAGLDDLLQRHTLRIPELDEYHYRVPGKSHDPAGDLRRRCETRLADLGLAKPAYKKRFEHEMDILAHASMEAYLLLVAEVTDYCREKAIYFQARGSASGSLICWLLGITAVDPLKWGLLMERFLSKDRTKPPDVDLDIEHTRRKELMEYLASRYSVAQIGTWSELGINGEDDQKGSLIVKMMSSRRKQGLPTDNMSIPQHEWDAVHRLDRYKAYAGYGVHAAGLLMTSTKEEMQHLVPMMWVASSSKLVSQYDMKDVEKLGLVKMDILGLKTMTVLKLATLNLSLDPAEGLEWIPLTDRMTYSTIARGDTAGVFQLEGNTAKRGCRELKPSKIDDVIAAMALYRPATMGSGATDAFVARKHKHEAVPERHDIIMKNTAQTYGILLYQEQVIAVLRDLGMLADDLTAFLKAVKASNGDIGNASGVIADMLVGIEKMCYEHGMLEGDVNWLNEALSAYSQYGFNQAHAVVYGMTAYRCAYLATHYPVEFYAALLNVAAEDPDKERLYLQAARVHKVRVAKPDINISRYSYEVDAKQGAIRKGLLSIKGVGPKAVTEIVVHQPYKDLDDLLAKVNPRVVTGAGPLIKALKKQRDNADQSGTPDPFADIPGVLGKLIEAGVMNSVLPKKEASWQ